MACCSYNNNSVSIFGTPQKREFVTQLKRVRLASTANITGIYSANTFTYAGYPLAIDGQNVALYDRVLLKDQTDPIQNGIYVVSLNGPAEVVLTRASDFQPACNNSKILITEGDSLTNSLWYNVGLSGFLFGISDVVFIRDDGVPGSGTGDITNGANVGGLVEVFKQKLGTILQFRTLEAGTNITLTQNTDTITIDSTGGGGSGRILFDVNNIELTVNNTSYISVGHMPWDQSEFGGYTDGRLTFYAEINDNEVEVEVRDIVNAVVLATVMSSGTGCYTSSIILPLSDTHIEVFIRNDGSGGTNYSKIYGITLSFME